MNMRAGLTDQQVHLAAAAADQSYSRDRAKLFDTIRHYKPFWFFGDVIACSRVDTLTDTAIVAVRGTRPIGNWLLTNFQAFYSPLLVVDALEAAPSQSFQNGTLRQPIAGRIHQGFLRAFSWLWYGTEPVVDDSKLSFRRSIQGLIKYATILFGPVALWYLAERLNFVIAQPFYTIWGLCLLSSMAILLIERGVVEGFFVQKRQPDGDPIAKLLCNLNQHRQVVFTGHSLGGAIATLMFGVYRIWCRSQPGRVDNGHLVTFGSGRVGDSEFVTAFEDMHFDRMIHFEHPGDPVPQIPPSGFYELLSKRYPIRGFGGLIISALFLPWTAFRIVYAVTTPTAWSTRVTESMGQSKYRRLCFTFHSMTKHYLPYTEKRARLPKVDA